MTLKKSMPLVLLIAVGFVSVYAQSRASTEELVKTGVAFYREGKYAEAAGLLRLAGGEPEALYWLSLSELSAGNYDGALAALDALEAAEPAGRWSAELPYHRGRCLFYLGRYEEAEDGFTRYADTLPEGDPRKAASFYWQGESLFAEGKLDGAADAFSAVAERYPHSAKYEAARYRLTLINQKKIEAELLSMLKWSHEESLKTIEEYEAREKQYEAAIADYQRRLGELMSAEVPPAPETNAADTPGLTDEERAGTIDALTSSARELSAALEKMLGEVE